MNERPYRTVFVGTLCQESALSVGGNAGDGETAHPFCRDGLGRPTLRGDGLAGALLATARKLYRELPACLSSPGGQRLPSVWIPHASHPLEHLATEVRPGVGLRQATGAAADGVLLETQILPRGGRWAFCLEVCTHEAEALAPGLGARVEAMAAAVLREWRAGRAWLGRDVARGLGWMRLRDLAVYRLGTHQADRWPDSFAPTPLHALAALGLTGQTLDAACPPETQPRPDRGWCFLELDGRIELGARPDGWGVDALAIAGASGLEAHHAWPVVHHLAPAGRAAGFLDEDDTDRLFALSRVYRDGVGRLEPILPGASLRGPLRHALSRRLRRAGVAVADPNARGAYAVPERPDPVEALFGDGVEVPARGSAALLIRDAYLADDSPPWLGVVLEQLAADEFTGGVYNKFDRAALMAGQFAWRMVLEAADRPRLARLWDRLWPVLRLAELGRVPLGGGKAAGLGGMPWRLEAARLWQDGKEEAWPLQR